MSLPALQNDSNVPSSKLYNGGNWWGNAILVHRSGASDGSADGIWGLSADQIKYDSANDIWVDLADGQPSKISDTWDVDTTAVTGSSTSANPVEVFLWNNNGGQFLGKFANPFYSSGGTSTEGVGVAVGSFYGVTFNSFSYKVYHSSAFSSSQTYELHSTTLTPTFISDLVVGAGAQNINSRTHTWGIPDVVEIRASNGDVLSSLTLAHPSKKKVHSNFW